MSETKKFIEAIGRRKESIARVRLTPGGRNAFHINDKELHQYFPTETQQLTVKQPMSMEGIEGHYHVTAHVKGGGIHAQAEAVRLGISRALTEINSEFRKSLKKAGFMKRDARAKERRKFGLKKARKSPQWSKR